MQMQNDALPLCGGCVGASAGFCSKLGNDLMDQLCSATELRQHAAGEPITTTEVTPAPMIVRNGIVGIVYNFPDGRRQVLDLLFPGDLLFVDARSSEECCHISAVTPVVVCEIDAVALEALLAREARARAATLAALTDETARKNQQLLDLGRKRADERLASFLVDYGRRSANSHTLPKVIRLSVSRTTIADFLCLTKETVSRSFTALREDGLIRLATPDTIEVTDLQALLRRAAGEDLAAGR